MRAINMRAAMLVAALLLAGAAWSEDGETTLDQGIQAFHAGDYIKAKGLFEKTVQISPADARAITFLAITQAALGECGRWTDELRQQALRNPNLELRKMAGLAFVQCQLPFNRYGAIMPILNDLQQRFPDDPDVIYESAKVYNKAWNYEIYDLYRKAPASYRVNQISAEVFEMQNRYADAAGEYRKAIEKNPTALNLHYRLGRALLLQGHDAALMDQAREQFEAELKLNPGDAVAEYQIGAIYDNQQKPAEAGAHFEKALAIAPSFAEALVALGKIRLEAKQYTEAVALFERAVRAQPAMEAAHYNLMIAYRDSGKNKEAQREKKELDRLQKPPEGEFTDFLKKLGEKAPAKP